MNQEIKEELFKRVNEKNFKTAKPIKFMYCEVNEILTRVPMGDAMYIWSMSNSKRGGLRLDLMVEGDELFLPRLGEEFFRDHMDEVFNEILTLAKDNAKKWCCVYLTLVYNNSAGSYGLYMEPIPYGTRLDLSSDVKYAIDMIKEEMAEEK